MQSSPRRAVDAPLIGTGNCVPIWNRMFRSGASLPRRGCRCVLRSAGSADTGGSGLRGEAALHGRTRANAVVYRTSCAISPKASHCKSLHSALARSIARVAQAEGQEPPRYHTVYNVHSRPSRALITLAVDDAQAYRHTHTLQRSRLGSPPLCPVKPAAALRCSGGSPICCAGCSAICSSVPIRSTMAAQEITYCAI